MIRKNNVFYTKAGILLLCFCLYGCGKKTITKESSAESISENIATESPDRELSGNNVNASDTTETSETETSSASSRVTGNSLQRVTEDSSEALQLAEIQKRNPYLVKCSFWNDVLKYWEGTREVTDISMYFNPLYQTDCTYYSAEQFQNDSPLIIHLAKNEIYARHGYIFKDSDLENYFMGQCWYLPSVSADQFDIGVLNDFENANLKLLASLDK